jgi:hypothetical protein
VRGATRIQVNVLLALSGAVAGALVGFAIGIIPMPDVTPLVAIPAALLDALRVPTLSIRKQVPQYWGRIFSARVVAVLYGTRLGVGPLTILPTWLWWAATAIAVSRGPWQGALVGVLFAVARTVTMWVVGTKARRLDRADGAIRIAIAALSLVALAACGGDDASSAAATTTSTPSTIRLEPETTTTTTPEDAVLDDLLLDDALPGFTLAGDDDVLDLDAAAEAEADPEAERALLETRGFVRGVARRWTDPHEDVVYVASYELGSKEQADLYLIDGSETLMARSAVRFDVPDVPGAFGFTTTEPDFVAHAVAFTRGPRWFLVVVGSSSGDRTEDEARTLAAAQSALAG